MAVDFRGHPMFAPGFNSPTRFEHASAVFVSLAIAGLVSYGVWKLTDSAPVEVESSAVQAATLEASANPILQTDELAALVNQLTAGFPSPNSMQARLVNTTDGNRNQILSMTIGSAGFECPQIRTSKIMGSGGSLWRVQCGEAFVYSIRVNEFGQFSVLPIRYGDIQGFEVPVRQEFPSEGRTILELEPE